jgi:hypothetical protein
MKRFLVVGVQNTCAVSIFAFRTKLNHRYIKHNHTRNMRIQLVQTLGSESKGLVGHRDSMDEDFGFQLSRLCGRDLRLVAALLVHTVVHGDHEWSAPVRNFYPNVHSAFRQGALFQVVQSDDQCQLVATDRNIKWLYM